MKNMNEDWNSQMEALHQSNEYCNEVINEMLEQLEDVPWLVVMERLCTATVGVAISNGASNHDIYNCFDMAMVAMRMDNLFDVIMPDMSQGKDIMTTSVSLWRESLRKCDSNIAEAQKRFKEVFPFLMQNITEDADIEEVLELAIEMNNLYERTFN